MWRIVQVERVVGDDVLVTLKVTAFGAFRMGECGSQVMQKAMPGTPAFARPAIRSDCGELSSAESGRRTCSQPQAPARLEDWSARLFAGHSLS